MLVDVPRDLQEATLDFAYPDEVDLPGWRPPTKVHPLQIREAARAIAHRGQDRSVQSVLPTGGHKLYLPVDPVSSFSSSEKVAWLERVDRETRKMDPRVQQVMASVVAVALQPTPLTYFAAVSSARCSSGSP